MSFLFFIFEANNINSKQKNMATKIKIDGIDKIIIKKLVEDARTPILSIAREVGISGAAIHQRLRKLENSDLMAGSKLILNRRNYIMECCLERYVNLVLCILIGYIFNPYRLILHYTFKQHNSFFFI